MTVTKEKAMKEEDYEIQSRNPSSYGCEILLEKATLEQVKDSSFPNDACLIWYKVDDKVHMDLCRTSKRVSLFDFYYDKYGPGSVQKIDFGYGKISPKLWRYQSPQSSTSEKKKRK